MIRYMLAPGLIITEECIWTLGNKWICCFDNWQLINDLQRKLLIVEYCLCHAFRQMRLFAVHLARLGTVNNAKYTNNKIRCHVCYKNTNCQVNHSKMCPAIIFITRILYPVSSGHIHLCPKSRCDLQLQ